MMKTRTSRSLFSALLARISKKFRSFPESREKIVKDVRSNETLTGKDAKMDKDTNVVETPAVVETDGPQDIMARKAKQGQGKYLMTVAGKADAAAITPELSKTLEAGYTIFTRDHQPVIIVKAVDWLKAQEVIVARKAARAKFLANLDPDIRAALPELADVKA